ncbi:hypothetical protein GKR41_00111 [Candidatus Vallotia lariciata]|nr:hypothetical protein GKR41_00111 [Candidatus Vallotia lariciata]
MKTAKKARFDTPHNRGVSKETAKFKKNHWLGLIFHNIIMLARFQAASVGGCTSVCSPLQRYSGCSSQPSLIFVRYRA